MNRCLIMDCALFNHLFSAFQTVVSVSLSINPDSMHKNPLFDEGKDIKYEHKYKSLEYSLILCPSYKILEGPTTALAIDS